ncbi:GNAT family N-acetyltransferase/peptidase C39 family protein [Glaciecola sp. MF2-115]|uniref:GNAT family N-acetyltransferase/peptidase C39 family protein n=1 Tax=Glaciecola sp. MF2-115 TaxID=3384827 RepID=UPI0039A164E3
MAANKESSEANLLLRLATIKDLDVLEALELSCFETDRLSRRRLSFWIKAEHGILVLAEKAGEVLAYGLVILRKGSRSARLYSLAVRAEARGQNIASDLLLKLEELSVEKQRLFMRLEVAEDNLSAIKMYKKLGYHKFGIYRHYYETGADALRFQKSIQQSTVADSMRFYPWYKQTTEFTCGPSALMMAMKYLNSDTRFDQTTEIDIWRHATTIFMTSGHGGCHPLGLALAAHERGFEVEVYSTQVNDLFVDGVRSEHKKSIMRIVEQGFIEQASELGVQVHKSEIYMSKLEEALALGWGVICLISTYQFDGKKAPHWVAITHADERCLYLHDPDGSEGFYSESGDRLDASNRADVGESEDIDLDYQHLPILKEDFASLSVFGKSKLRTCLVVKPRTAGRKTAGRKTAGPKNS